jgi:LmbE family N-acetylglucosaminyl deacetylase
MNSVRSIEFANSIRILRDEGFNAEIFDFESANQIRDGHMYADFTRDFLIILEGHINDLNPKFIVAPAFEGGHQDHDTTAIISIYLARRSKSKLIHFSTYRSSSRILPTFTTMNPISSESRFKHDRLRTSILAIRLIRNYKSQFRSFVFLSVPIVIRYLANSWHSSSISHQFATSTLLYERRSKAKSLDVINFTKRVLMNHDQ